jgi:hypothetical protein
MGLTPFWIASTVPPEVTVSGLTAQITVPEPTWAQAALTYTVDGAPVDATSEGGTATLAVTLKRRTEYAFVLTVTDGIHTVTSLPTQPFRTK